MSDIGTELQITPVDTGFELAGELDAHTAPSLEHRLQEQVEVSSDIELHLAGLSFMDSSGLRVLLATTERCRTGDGDLVLVEPTPTVSRLLEVSGLADHFTVRHAT